MTTDHKYLQYPDEFADIAPYNEGNYYEKLVALTREPGFEHAVRFSMPNVDYAEFCKELISVTSQADFQTRIMGNFLAHIEKASTSGITADGLENIDPSKNYTFISNHRDIVLDAALLNLMFLRHNLPVTQIAIGSNLLIMDWITDLVKINRSFIVKRDLPKMEALSAARHLSAYIHYTICNMHDSIWIAQRQGRAKDSNDHTQESLIKMLSLAGEGSAKDSIMETNLLPVSISYEYDPNDYLKARELLLRRRDPDFKKTQRDDLFSMETGLTGFKGRVHFSLSPCINNELQSVDADCRNEVVAAACSAIDKSIFKGYYLYPINYIAYDIVNNTDKYKSQYSAEDLAAVDKYVDNQLAKVDIPDVTDEEKHFMRITLLNMYANPVQNKEIAEGSNE